MIRLNYKSNHMVSKRDLKHDITIGSFLKEVTYITFLPSLIKHIYTARNNMSIFVLYMGMLPQ